MGIVNTNCSSRVSNRFSKIETPDDWKRYSGKNLMGAGVYEPIPGIEPYYFNQISELFETKAGVKLFAYN